MNSNRLLIKLLLKKWDNMKRRGHRRKSWVEQVDSLDLQDDALYICEIILLVRVPCWRSSGSSGSLGPSGSSGSLGSSGSSG